VLYHRARRLRAILIAHLDGVRPRIPLSIEKLCPVLSFYIVKGLARGMRTVPGRSCGNGGMGHTMVHSTAERVGDPEFGLKKPAFRIVFNTADDLRVDRADDRPRPAMTLGCVAATGATSPPTTSRRATCLTSNGFAYEISPVANRFERAAGGRSMQLRRSRGCPVRRSRRSTDGWESAPTCSQQRNRSVPRVARLPRCPARCHHAVSGPGVRSGPGVSPSGFRV